MRTFRLPLVLWTLVLSGTLAPLWAMTASPAGQRTPAEALAPAPGSPAPVATRQSAPPPAATPQAQPAAPKPGARQIWCGQEIGPPSKLPPADSGPVIYYIGVCFPDQGGVSVIEPETYLYYIKTKTSTPSENRWVAWDEAATPEAIRADFKSLWGTTFLDNLSIEVTDYPFPNGVVGKLIAYNIEERQRVKVVSYEGTKHLEESKIDEKLKEENSQIRLDSFIDPAMVRKVKKIVLDMLSEKGYQFASVTPEIKAIPGGPKLVNLTFLVDEGPQVKIRDVEFTGNKSVSDGKLKRQMKNNHGKSMFSFIFGASSYQEAKYEEDADKVQAYYRDHGYIGARIGDPELRYVDDSNDRRTRWVMIRIPVTEGERYRVAQLSFEGNKIVKSEALRGLFKVQTGDWYSDKVLRKGWEKARDLYGAGGYYQFNLVPMTRPHDPNATADGKGTTAEGAKPADAAAGAADKADATAKAEPAKAEPAKAEPAKADATAKAAEVQKPGDPAKPDTPKPGAETTGKAGDQAPAAPGAQKAAKPLPKDAPLVDVVLQVDEGKQYFVNRIIFTGNTTTRDAVVRREIRLFEEGVFNTEALKYSVKRINQLGYFKQLEGTKDVDVKEAPGFDNKMDVTMKLEEQNRNQLQFGAGISQYEGFFGTLGFQTANFMGRGETFSVNLSAGTRSQNYQVAFTEPYLFDRALTGGIDVFKRRLEYISQFTQDSTGGNIVFGFPVKDFTRGYVSYSYEHTKVVDVNPIYQDPQLIANNPYLADALLLGTAGGVRVISKIVPSLSRNTIDNPMFPTTGKRYTLSVDLAGLGGNTNFFKPVIETAMYFKHTNRTSFAFRVQGQYISVFSGRSEQLPITEKLYLGGEYSLRGFDIRTIGPRALTTVMPTYNGSTFLPAVMAGEVNLTPYQTDSGLVIGGNKSLLLNVEYLISIAGPVRLVLFADTGQVQDVGRRFNTSDFKASTGAEVRFFMPVLNVPFRLIMAYNPLRSGILNNSLQLQKAFAFKFAVGSTF
jgi:outer membrane protein insertion porin family